MIGGDIREQRDFKTKLRTGLFEAKVIAINPDNEEFEKKELGYLEEGKTLEYLGETEEGHKQVIID